MTSIHSDYLNDDRLTSATKNDLITTTTSTVMVEPNLVDYRMDKIDSKRNRYPHCLVWTPIPCLTWLLPFIGHMGIGRTDGVIRDFAGPYYVSEDNMAFGRPTRYLQLDLNRIPDSNPRGLFDKAVEQASDEYKKRMHNLCCDNCHSHVAMALNTMNYSQKQSYNMFYLTFWMFCCGKFVSFLGFVLTWLPFLILIGIIVGLSVFFKVKH
ncbi:unnamed protein product [Didymodactylos carnosus]|uniref:Transmembrane protein 222 n=1 Tax=Didymodactylos carnosus TaxID=1234261 RepID=A0A814C9G9_9BILA|nr:unnamed protein product [Didymodactylos carnosus]CAF1376570.1 unnamed protein product [Didymodactylos carnosus]CAF3717690.1 unnamed protein product [Didymodactylos carnosus]CAF4185264.1 unnamed protein product [Didymodactylos carnosus]